MDLTRAHQRQRRLESLAVAAEAAFRAAEGELDGVVLAIGQKNGELMQHARGWNVHLKGGQLVRIEQRTVRDKSGWDVPSLKEIPVSRDEIPLAHGIAHELAALERQRVELRGRVDELRPALAVRGLADACREELQRLGGFSPKGIRLMAVPARSAA